jgi:hypothetical protein
MGDSRNRLNPETSSAEKAAQRWHENANHKRDGDDCWCRCSICKEVNPYWKAAQVAVVTDINDRLRDAIGNAARVPYRGHAT